MERERKSLLQWLIGLIGTINTNADNAHVSSGTQPAANKDDETSEETDGNQLLDCLQYFVRLHGRTSSRSSLITGLPLVDGELTPTLYVRAATRADLKSDIFAKPIDELADCVLPVILILEDNRACVLTDVIGGEATVLYPPHMDRPVSMQLSQLMSVYSGYAIYTSPIAESERAHVEESEREGGWFWNTILQFKRSYMQIGAASLLMNIMALAVPMFVMNVYDRVVPNNAIETLWVLAGGALVVIGFDFIIRNMRSRIIDSAGKKIDWILASKLMEKVMSIKMEDKPSSVGAFANEINSYESVRTFFTTATIAAVFDIPFIPIFLIVIGLIGGPIVMVALTAIPIVVAVAVFLELPIRSSAQQYHSINLQKHSFLFEMLTGLESIKTLNSQGRAQKKWEDNAFTSAKYQEHTKAYSNFVTNFTAFMTQVVTVISVIIGVYLIVAGELTMGGLIACSILNGRVLMPLAQLTNIIINYQQAKLGLANLNRIMDMDDELLPEGQQLFHDEVRGDVEFDDVFFQYANQKKPAVRNLSFSARSGEKVGIIGRIGSGKTTLLKLILGLYHATDGHVKIDGIDISHINPCDLRREVGYVSQAPALFAGTIRDNIAYANPSEDNEKILRASKISGADDFISRHPDGYNMQVGERGEFLSSGQQQAVGLARALVSDPKVLLLDEPCSNMDSLSERQFIAKLKDIIPDKTIFLATHKMSLLAFVEKIIVIDRGNMVMFGTREQVLKALNDGSIKVRV